MKQTVITVPTRTNTQKVHSYRVFSLIHFFNDYADEPAFLVICTFIHCTHLNYKIRHPEVGDKKTHKSNNYGEVFLSTDVGSNY